MPDLNQFYLIKSLFYTGPLARDDVTLVTCADTRYFIKPAALGKCFQTSESTVCPKSLLLKASQTDWLGVAWSPLTRVPFQRLHRRAPNCNNLHQLIHIGTRFYVGTTETTITMVDTKGKQTFVSITPLSVLHMPCNFSFDSQATGLAKC